MRPDRYLKTEALVMGTMRLREADRIVTLYTKERGRLSAVAKGVRRTKSRIGGRLEPFSLVHVVLYAGGGSLYTITAVQTIRSFQGVRDSLARMEEGGRLLEALRRLFPEEEGNPAAFNLLVRGVARLAAAADRPAAALVVLATRLKLLVALGYLPELDSCVECGSEGSLRGFRPSLGGMVCGECFAHDHQDCFSISAEGLDALRSLVERPLSEVARAEIGGCAAAEVERAVAQTLAHHAH
ncbi:MAG: DNA repair protein RecO [Thermoleophilia bacterium]